jgi:glycosyltransferase involved in cell wall biosynthesis
MNAVEPQKVFILTNFSTWLGSFSPIIVVGEQLKMLRRNGYEPVLIATETWVPPEDSIFAEVKTEYMFPTGQHDPEVRVEAVDEMVEITYTQLKEILPEDALVITHDLIFLPDYTVYNLAARRLANECPRIHWLHWIHSATNPRQVGEERAMFGDKYVAALESQFPNSIICYPNAEDTFRVAANFGFEEDKVVEVPHSTDPTDGMNSLVQRLYDDKRLGDADVLMVLPVRLDRGKNVEMNVRLIAGCRQIGLRPHLVVCDFQSTAGDKVVYRKELQQLARELGVEDCVTFISEFDDLASMEISHDIVLDLFSLSNVFMLASKSETYSLVAQEAMMRGNFCMLNYDFPAFRQIYGKKAIYRGFGANVDANGLNGETTRNFTDVLQYFQDLAKEIKYWLENDKVIAAKTWVRTKRNPDYIFREYIEPLLMASKNEAENK